MDAKKSLEERISSITEALGNHKENLDILSQLLSKSPSSIYDVYEKIKKERIEKSEKIDLAKIFQKHKERKTEIQEKTIMVNAEIVREINEQIEQTETQYELVELEEKICSHKEILPKFKYILLSKLYLKLSKYC
jgi:hypothetical protein